MSEQVRARLFRQPKSAMQSGLARTREWVLEWDKRENQAADPIMGWISSGDTQRQVRLFFDTREEGERYAAREGLTLEVELPSERVIKPKAYADNFKFGRRNNWTH